MTGFPFDINDHDSLRIFLLFAGGGVGGWPGSGDEHGATGDAILQEVGDMILQEQGDDILQEQ